MVVELDPLHLESVITMQKILECPDHTARLQLLRSVIEAETKRLNTKKKIQGIFSDAVSREKHADQTSILPEGQTSGGSERSADDTFQ